MRGETCRSHVQCLGLEPQEAVRLAGRHPRILMKSVEGMEASRARLMEWGLSASDVCMAVQRLPALLTTDLYRPALARSVQYLRVIPFPPLHT